MDGKQIGMLILMILLLILAIAAYIAYQKIRKHITDFSEATFGTSNIVEGINKQADELANTPKSVTGMTRLMEPQIIRGFPEFTWEEFKHKAENMLISALEAIAQENASLLKEASQQVKNQVANQIGDNRASGCKEFFQKIHIHQTEIANYTKRDGTCTITIQSAVEYYHYKECDGKVIGEKERKTQTRYNVELMYIQDETIAKIDNAVGTTCPNCGAPITNLGRKRCEYCGTEVVPINTKVWSFHKFYEVDYHHI